MTYFCALGIFRVKVLKYTSIKCQYLKYTNDDITEMEEIFFFKLTRKLRFRKHKCLIRVSQLTKENEKPNLLV